MALTYFISDVHLGFESKTHPENEEAKMERLLGFLEHVRTTGERLIIAGDLFDFWFEYRHVVPRGYHRLYTKLEQLTSRGIEVRFLAGNHDFWIGKFFPKVLGVQIEKKPFELGIAGRRFYIAHGDGFAKNDTGYLILRRILRNKLSVALFSMIHPTMAFGIARMVSKKSRDYTGTKNYGEEDGMKEFAERMLNEGFDYVIMGHRHIPLYHIMEKGVYVNLGDWMVHNSYAVFDETELHLKTWKTL
ncbi:MAG: UDP-2,3-diacylglucosamine diphosphatase [Bacteroidota bacterium]